MADLAYFAKLRSAWFINLTGDYVWRQSKVMEKVNNATLQKLRNRRAKLKRLHSLTRKNKSM